MGLDDIYKTEEKNKLEYITSMIPIIIFIFVGFVVGLIIYDKIDKYYEQRAKFERRMESVSKPCRNLAPSDKLFFVSSRTVPTTETETTVVFTYRTEKSFDEVMRDLRKWFDIKDWRTKDNSDLNFINGNQDVSINSTDNFLTNYEITCHEKEVSYEFVTD